jgi:hypothetical protein
MERAEAVIPRSVGRGMAGARGLHESIDHDVAPGLDVDEVRSGVAAPALDRPADRGLAPRDDRDGAAAGELLRPGAGHGAHGRDQARRRDIALRGDELDASAGAGCAVGGNHRAILGRDVEPRDQADVPAPPPGRARTGALVRGNQRASAPVALQLDPARRVDVDGRTDAGRSAGARDVASDRGPCLHDEVTGRGRTGGADVDLQRVALRRDGNRDLAAAQHAEDLLLDVEGPALIDRDRQLALVADNVSAQLDTPGGECCSDRQESQQRCDDDEGHRQSPHVQGLSELRRVVCGPQWVGASLTGKSRWSGRC